MDALNRHLKSETGVECARVVERGKGSGPGGGDVLGELDSGFDMSGVMMSSVTGGGGGGGGGMVVELGDELKQPGIPKRRQMGGGGGGGADIWSGPGVTL